MAANVNYPQLILAWLQPAAAQPLSRRFLPLWLAIRAELSPIVGDSGFSALFVRCLFKCGDLYPWLTLPHGVERGKFAFGVGAAALASELDRQSPEAGLAASRTLFATFYNLLLVLIGERLTAGVLDAAWGRVGMLDAAGRSPG